MISANAAMPGSYDQLQVALSVLIAIAASCAALDLAGRVTAASGWARLAWMTGGAAAMGIGIWSMRFTGMLAFSLPVPLGSPWPTVLLALVAALLASAFALHAVSGQKLGLAQALAGSLVMGGGIAAMHYVGMAASFMPTAVAPDLSHAVSVSTPGTAGIGSVTLIGLGLAVCMCSVDRRLAAQAAELERRLRERTSQLTVANDALTESEFRKLVEALPDAIFVISEDKIVFVNPFGMRLLGAQQPEQPIGKDVSEIIHPDSLASIRRRMRDCYQTGVASPPKEYVLIALDGSSVEIESAAIPITWKGSPAIELIARDIRERKRAEERLREYEKAVEGLEEMIVVIDREYRYVLANRSFLNYHGMKKEQLVGRLVTEVLNPGVFETIAKEKLDECFQGRVVKNEMKYTCPQLGERDVSLSYFPIEGPKGVDRAACILQDVTEHKRAEEAVRESEDRYRDLVEHSQDLLCTHDLAGTLLSCNPAPARILGYEVGELLKIPMRELIAPEFREQFDQYLARIKTNGKDKGVMAVITRTGERRIWEYNNALRTEGVPSPIVRGMAHDITERKKAERELRASEERFRQLAENIREAFYLADAKGYQLLYVSPAFEQVWGRTCQSLYEAPDSFLDAIHPDDREAVRHAFVNPVPFAHEYRVVRPDGSLRWIWDRGFPIRDTKGQVYRFAGIAEDITERKQAEEALLRLAAIVESSADPIISKDLNGVITSWNAAAKRIFGYTETEALGQPITIIIPPELLNEETQILPRLRAGEHIQHYETTRVTKLGKRVDVSLTVSAVKDSEGRVVGASKIARDITERKQAEQVLRESQAELARVIRIATMGELTASIAHEINQPLAAVVTNANFCLRQLASGTANLKELREAIAEIVNDGARASEVIARIRTLLKKDASAKIELDMNDVIQEAVVLVRGEVTRNQVSLRTDLAADLPRLFGDRVQLQQVLINLVVNGIDAMRTLTDRPRELLIKSAKHPDGVLIQVQDSGTGLDPQQVDRIFEPFFTTKPRGIGMGLSISRSIVEAHGGRLWAESGSKGGLFQFTLPASADGVS